MDTYYLKVTRKFYMTPYVLSFDYKCVFKGIEVIKLSSNFLYTFDQEIDFFKSWHFEWYFLLFYNFQIILKDY